MPDEEKAGGSAPQGEELFQELERRLREKSPSGHYITLFDDSVLMEDLRQTNYYYDKNLPGPAKSERPVLGPIYRRLKRIVARLTGWYINPALNNQRLFNATITRTVNEMRHYLDHLQINEDILSTIMRRDLALFHANLKFLSKHLEQRVHELDMEIKQRSKLLREHGDVVALRGESDSASPVDILALEQQVRGTPKEVKESLRVFLSFFRDCSNTAVLGCGRGELLELLAEEGIPARGVENNFFLVNYCRERNLQVERADSLEYLQSLEDSSLDGIFSSRFAGYETPPRILGMLDLCRRKLADGGVLAIECPDPISSYTGSRCFLDDGSYVYPLDPETLRMLCFAFDFGEPKVIYLNPLPSEKQLVFVDVDSEESKVDPEQKELFDTINENVFKINRLLFGHSDYAVVARRNPRQ